MQSCEMKIGGGGEVKAFSHAASALGADRLRAAEPAAGNFFELVPCHIPYHIKFYLRPRKIVKIAIDRLSGAVWHQQSSFGRFFS